MSLSDTEREILIQLHIEKAQNFSRMEQLRKLADYNCTTSVSEDEVAELAQPARELIDVIITLIKNEKQ